MGARVVYPLVEFEKTCFPRQALSEWEAATIWRDYGKLIDVEPPSMNTEGQWCLTSRGAVGFLPIGDDAALQIRPRVPISNIFRMWEVAHQVPLDWLGGAFFVDSLEELYSRIASRLAELTQRRLQRGLYRAYLDTADRLQYVRGRVQLTEVATRPWSVTLPCEFQDHTANVEDNGIVLAALHIALRTPACLPEMQADIRHAYQGLLRVVDLMAIPPSACLGRTYTRLNADYEPMHWLAYFILAHSGPTHHPGGRKLTPFVIDMPRLFERFVASWLKARCPSHIRVEAQQPLGIVDELSFQPDIVLYDVDSGRPILVLDTKYKNRPKISSDDIAQVVAYATHLGCVAAALVYPFAECPRRDFLVGHVRVKSLPFALGGDLDRAGTDVLDALPIGSPNRYGH